MSAVDTSVAVAALAHWHVANPSARRLAAGASIPAHARLEAYSVLTRLPQPERLTPEIAGNLLERWFPAERTLVPSFELSREMVERCRTQGVSGGAVYDALVGLTALEAGARLITRDERAARTYGALGIDVEYVG